MSQALVVVGTSDGALHALRMSDGAVCWEHQGEYSLAGAALTAAQGTLFVASLDGYLLAFQPADGTSLWKQHLLNTLFALPSGQVKAVSNGNLLALQYGRQLEIVHPQNGTVLWEYSSLAYFGNLLTIERSLFYLREQGRMPSRRPHPVPPSLEERRSSGKRPTIVTTARSVQDGSEQWSTSEIFTARPAGNAASSLLEVGKVVYVYGQGLLALDRATGQVLWAREVSQNAHVGHLVAGASLLFLANGVHVGAYRIEDGQVVWSEAAPKSERYFEHFDRVLFMEDTLYVGRGQFNPHGFQLEARDPRTGNIQAVWPKNSALLRPDISWHFQGSDGLLFVPADNGLYAVDGSNGQQRWFAELDIMPDTLLALALSE